MIKIKCEMEKNRIDKKTLNLSDVSFLIDEYYPVARDTFLSFNSVSSYYELFKSLFTFKKVLNCCKDNCLSLYRKNFILQHILYKLQFEFYKDFNFALIIDSNLLLFDKIQEPPSFFSISQCKFIKLSEPIHQFNRDNLPTVNGLRDYYLDLSNFLKAREDSVKDAIDIGLKIAIDPAILTDALNIFGLSQSSLTLEKVKKRYHRLLKLHHPDKADERSLDNDIKNNSKFTTDENPAEDSENFEIIKIIEAYQILKSLFI